ncbi:MAG: hypothetical protein LBJ46_06030 [Planctomycetota bacterium]|jgi:hypothetical protein|nr:hypothetical protein [Planctomycetota bacterium]
MEPTECTPETREPGQASSRRPKAVLCGVIGMILGFIGMICAIAGPHIVEEAHPRPPIRIDYDQITDTASDVIADVAAKTTLLLVILAAVFVALFR